MAVTRDQILSAAAHEFAEKGYTGATLARVGQRLGLSKSAILYHFESKEQLFEEMLEPVTRDTTDFLDSWATLPTLASRIEFIAALIDLQAQHYPEILVLNNDRLAWQRGKVGVRMEHNYTRQVDLLTGPDPTPEKVTRAHTALAIFFRAITSGLDMREPVESSTSEAGQQVLRICADILRG